MLPLIFKMLKLTVLFKINILNKRNSKRNRKWKGRRFTEVFKKIKVNT